MIFEFFLEYNNLQEQPFKWDSLQQMILVSVVLMISKKVLTITVNHITT